MMAIESKERNIYFLHGSLISSVHESVATTLMTHIQVLRFFTLTHMHLECTNNLKALDTTFNMKQDFGAFLKRYCYMENQCQLSMKISFF